MPCIIVKVSCVRDGNIVVATNLAKTFKDLNLKVTVQIDSFEKVSGGRIRLEDELEWIVEHNEEIVANGHVIEQVVPPTKKSKRLKMPHQPKGKKNAFLIFSQERGAELKKEGMKHGVKQAISTEWEQLKHDPKRVRIYEEKATAEKQKYIKKMQEYSEKYPDEFAEGLRKGCFKALVKTEPVDYSADEPPASQERVRKPKRKKKKKAAKASPESSDSGEDGSSDEDDDDDEPLSRQQTNTPSGLKKRKKRKK